MNWSWNFASAPMILAKAEDIRGTRTGLHLREAKIKGGKHRDTE